MGGFLLFESVSVVVVVGGRGVPQFLQAELALACLWAKSYCFFVQDFLFLTQFLYYLYYFWCSSLGSFFINANSLIHHSLTC